MVTSDDGVQVPVVQAFAFGKYLGYLKVTFNDGGHVMRWTGNPILLNSSIPQGEKRTLVVTIFKKNDSSLMRMSHIVSSRSTCSRGGGGMEEEPGQLLNSGGRKDSGLSERDQQNVPVRRV